MILGISGKISSGKDTVGRITQLLIAEKGHVEHTTDSITELTNGDYEGFNINSLLEEESGYEIKKFADKLKEIGALLIGCSREDLEDREFKEKELSEEWDLIRETSSYGAADQIYPSDYKGLLHLAHSRKESLTPRKILQLLGTECGREIIHPNVWVNALFADYKEGDNWIITDMRFPNELKAVKDRGGITIRVNRDGATTGDDHPSETALDNAKFDYVIDNNSTIEDLVGQVKGILIKEEIL